MACSFCSGNNNQYGLFFSTSDTIGRDEQLYPCIGLRSQDGSIEVNFGSRNWIVITVFLLDL
ncbi:hypothetical protein C2G38_2180028 [Gigaspora rosea]|uniref:Uncharacterized protein n=1 Tax=Gigaspora rosea TaxID=44941 RepID=A0A397VFR3_9GLOM|nr:hypothetical protein C2G38_2180028 [Gigaspora rosea]